MTERRHALALISSVVCWDFLAIYLLGTSLNLGTDLLPALISLVYGSAVAVCLASVNFRLLSKTEFLAVTVLPILLLSNLGALLMLFCTFTQMID